MAEEEGGKKVKIPLIGLLAVKNKLLAKEDLQAAMAHCNAAQDTRAALVEYLVSNQLVSDENIKRLIRAAKALDLRQKEFRFGAIAIQKGFINKSVLSLVLEEQQKNLKEKKQVQLIGDMLVDAGMLTEKQRDYILKLQKRVREETEKQRKEKKVSPASEDGGDEERSMDTPDDQEDGENGGLLEPEVITGGIKLEIAGNLMAAFLSKTDYFDTNITVEDIKETLTEKGIVLGIVSDEMIEGFIKSSGFKTKSFRIAKGIAPVQGKDAKVEFFFNTDYLTAGGLTDDGTIDFKDRGEVPYVEEGTVLAEKIPMVEAKNGRNIYGDELETVPGQDIPFKIGKGAKLSEDGFKVISAVNGFPKYALSGHIFVHDVYTTQGDVDYETGHIHYDGNVDVKGRIKSGFKVKGNNISAVEVDGGILHAEGDVKIAGGINEGKIYARGNVYAKFIHKSEITCMGNVVVQKEIVDSTVECSGSCIAEAGKLISTNLTAKMGISVQNIGSEMSKPCRIVVGYDAFTQNELKQNKAKREELKKQISQIEEKKAQFNQENLELQKQITELAHVQDRSQLEEKELASKLAQPDKETADADGTENLSEKIKELKQNAQKAEEALDKCFDRSEEIESLIELEDKNIKALEKKMADLIQEKDNLVQWAKDNPGKPMVIVRGAVAPETVIRGEHCEMRISEMVRHARISEVLCRGDDGQSLNIYEMQVGNI